jgi:glycosyltransferase involved in cell wall biosynthesis
MKKPRISVIIPAHNEEAEIKKTLDCVLKQNFKSMEIIVSNDGSTDKTEEIAKEYIRRDKRIKIISSKTGHSGAYARNKGAGIANGEILVFLDADARTSDNFLERVDKNFKNHKIQGIIHPKRDTYNNFLSKTIALMASNNRKIARNIGAKIISKRNVFSLFIFTKKAFEKIGGYDDKILYYDDRDITERFFKNKFKAYLDPSILLYSAQPEDLDEFFRRYKWSGEGIAAMPRGKVKLGEIIHLSKKIVIILGPFILLPFTKIIGTALILVSIIATYLFNLRTSKDFLWSFLMIPTTYAKNIIEFSSMMWYSLFPRKNTRD